MFPILKSMVAHTCYPSTWAEEAGELPQIWGQPVPQNKILFQNQTDEHSARPAFGELRWDNQEFKVTFCYIVNLRPVCATWNPILVPQYLVLQESIQLKSSWLLVFGCVVRTWLSSQQIVSGCEPPHVFQEQNSAPPKSNEGSELWATSPALGLFSFVFVSFFWDRVSVCNFGWPGTCCVDQAGPQTHRDPFDCASWLGAFWLLSCRSLLTNI